MTRVPSLFSKSSLILLILLLGFFSGCTSNNETPGSSWIDTYTPLHSLGTGTNDFWETYPLNHPNSSEPVNHLAWVLESLNEHGVMIVVHRTGCITCQPQADRMIALADKYGNNTTFYDLDISRGGDTEQKAYESYVYDPAGPPGYIALTVLVTTITVNGNVVNAWHSWEGDVDDAELEGWVQDTIYYYHMNTGN